MSSEPVAEFDNAPRVDLPARRPWHGCGLRLRPPFIVICPRRGDVSEAIGRPRVARFDFEWHVYARTGQIVFTRGVVRGPGALRGALGGSVVNRKCPGCEIQV